MKLMRMTLLLLLLAILAMPHTADAQTGYTVSRTRGLDNVIATGNNQAIPAVVLTPAATGSEPPITRTAGTDLTLSVKFGDLPIVQATAWTVPATGDPTQVEAISGDFNTDDAGDDVQFKMGAKELLIFIQANASGSDGVDQGMVKLADLRLDLTSMAAGGSVPITVTASDQANTIGLGTGGGRGSVSATLTTAADGLTVAAAKGNGLTCGTIGGASVTVSEGFVRAWNPTLRVRNAVGPDFDAGRSHATGEDGVSGAVMIRLDVINFPTNTGAKIEWPASVADNRDDTDPDTAGKQNPADIATLTLDTENSDANGKFAIYSYADADSTETGPGADTDLTTTADNTGIGTQRYLNDAARSFKIDGLKFTNFGGAAIDVTAQLWPAAKRNSDGKKNAADVKSTLSFEHDAEAPEFGDDERDGAWLIVADCVTYLLYPFVTCGGTAGWSTGITVSNTSADAHVFGPLTSPRSNRVPSLCTDSPRGRQRLPKARWSEPVVSTLSANLMAGDTIVADCGDTTMAGMDGYAIIKANFQHARGMAFVFGNFMDGAGVDVSHGYMAEMISDPATRSEKLCGIVDILPVTPSRPGLSSSGLFSFPHSLDSIAVAARTSTPFPAARPHSGRQAGLCVGLTG